MDPDRIPMAKTFSPQASAVALLVSKSIHEMQSSQIIFVIPVKIKPSGDFAEYL
jgi:hypothetical protein